jgi:hypothetical protein
LAKKESRGMEADPSAVQSETGKWRLSATSTAWRLFATCWLVYAIHASTDVVRHYPAARWRMPLPLDDYGGSPTAEPGYGGTQQSGNSFCGGPVFLSRPVVDRL